MLDYLLQFEIIFLLMNIIFLLIILFLHIKKRYPIFSRKFIRFLELKGIKKDLHNETNKISNLDKEDKKDDLKNTSKSNDCANSKCKTTQVNLDLKIDSNTSGKIEASTKIEKEKKNKKNQKPLKEEKENIQKEKIAKTLSKDNLDTQNKEEIIKLEKIKELEEAKKLEEAKRQELENINSKIKKKTEEEILRDKEINRVCKQVLIYTNAHELDKAQAACIQGLIIDNKSNKLNLELAKIYELKGDYEKSEFIYKDLIAQDKNNPDNYRHLSRILNFQGKQKLSYELLKKCYYYSQDKTDSHLLFDLITLALSQNDFDTVDKFSIEMLKEYPYHKETLLIYAKSSLNKGNTDKAYDLLNKILQLDPYNEQAKQMMITLNNR